MHDTSELKAGSYTAAFSEAIVTEGARRPEVVAITAAMPDSTGLLPFGEEFPDRLFDVGIAEQHAVTSAAGMAMGGLRPVVAVYSTFLTRAFDQVNLDVGLHGQPVVFVLDRAGITGDDGASHHGLLDMVLLSKVPNMTVVRPVELRRGRPDAARRARPVHRRARRHPLPEDHAARRRRRRRIGAVGPPGPRAAPRSASSASARCSPPARAAAERLAAEGHDVTVWDPRLVKPLDPEMLADAAGHRLVVTIEDGLRDGGAGSAIADALSQARTRTAGPQVRVLGVPSVYLRARQARRHPRPPRSRCRRHRRRGARLGLVAARTDARPDQRRRPSSWCSEPIRPAMPTRTGISG